MLIVNTKKRPSLCYCCQMEWQDDIDRNFLIKDKWHTLEKFDLSLVLCTDDSCKAIWPHTHKGVITIIFEMYLFWAIGAFFCTHTETQMKSLGSFIQHLSSPALGPRKFSTLVEWLGCTSKTTDLLVMFFNYCHSLMYPSSTTWT